MKMWRFSGLFLFFGLSAVAQVPDSLQGQYLNSAENMLKQSGKLTLGGYGEVHFNQPLDKEIQQLGQVDVHRMVMFLGYNFNHRTQFVTETEVEYAKEIWVEQAFLQHKLSRYVNFRAGLLLVPMGIINEYHEPVNFNGVERPVIDNKLSATTWREIGAGFSGTILPLTLKYQLYVMNGLNGYDTRGILSGSKGFREARQKGSKAYVNSPAFSGKLEYFGIGNLNAGLSLYTGKTQSRLLANLPKDSVELQEKADSSRVGIVMLGSDFRYQYRGISLRGQLYFTQYSNTEAYNVFTQIAGKFNDLGRQNLGYYLELGYNVFSHNKKIPYELIPFVRYEFFNLHHKVDGLTTHNKSYQNTIVTSGLTFKLTPNAVIKTDFQLTKEKGAEQWIKIWNAGFGVNF